MNTLLPPSSSTTRKRGRPAGSKAQVVLDADLGVHHFAFVRAWLQGLDSKWAWDRYMAFAESNADLRHVAHRRKAILAQAIKLGHQLNLTLPEERKITSLLNVLSREPVIAPAKVLPSMDEFIQLQGHDPDMFSEAELIELYQEHYAHTEKDEDTGSSEHVRALNQLASMLAVPPSPSDPVSRWLEPRLAARIQASGAVNLGHLVDLINVHGYNWFKRIPYLGETRARRITGWLVSLEHPALSIRETSLVAPQRDQAVRTIDTRHVMPAKRFALVPLEQLEVPTALLGERGLFRTGMPNTLGAHNDFEAIQNWLRKYDERPHTRRSYKKEVERFYLWALLERQKPLSSLDALDCQSYRAFLANLPHGWLCPKGARPVTDAWRPFRTQIAPSSQKLALVIIQTLFEGLRDAGYLVANPMSAVMKGFNLPAPRINVDRSFSNAEWAYLMNQAELEPASLFKGRLILLLELLVSMGLRTDELTQARRSDLRKVPVKDEPEAWVLVVTGKRRKQREVLVPDHVVEMINQHNLAFDLAGALPSLALIRSLGGVPQWVAREDQAVLARPSCNGNLGHAGIYAVLKRFFRRAAERCEDPHIDAGHLRQASTHWLRHTFGRQAAADEVPLEVIQQALGHASLATTTIYTSTERDRMIRALRRQNRPR